jgi:hypothetical protein
LTLQQNPNYPGLVSSLLHGHPVLNLTEGHHPLYPILWASILEDSKLSGVLGTSSWVVWMHENLQLDSLRLVCIRTINLVRLLHLENKKNGGLLVQRRRQSSRSFGKLTHDNCLDRFFFNRSVISVLYVERIIAIYDCHLF